MLPLLPQIPNVAVAKGLWDNTLVLIFADNGGDNPGGSASNYPLLGRKCLAWEGGTRVFAAASGGMIPATLRGTSNAELMHIADWYVELYVECAGSVFFITFVLMISPFSSFSSSFFILFHPFSSSFWRPIPIQYNIILGFPCGQFQCNEQFQCIENDVTLAILLVAVRFQKVCHDELLGWRRCIRQLRGCERHCPPY